jgi:hypothetical protein
MEKLAFNFCRGMTIIIIYKLMRDLQIIVVIRNGETILNHGVKAMLGVTANNDNDDDSDNEIRKSGYKKDCKRRV